MNVSPGGLAGAMGALSLDRSANAPQRAVTKPVEAVPALQKQQQNTGGFQAGLIHARAVTAPQKAEAAPAIPNPNLPRGSVIDLKV
ncbi:MAG: hypothetical protein ACKVH0_08880 [Alphaproteobacteria bacterium]